MVIDFKICKLSIFHREMCESHVKEDFNTMHAYTVVCDWDHTLAHNYYINRVSLSQDYTP